MADNPVPAPAPRIAVAGDVCFDVVALAVPPAPAGAGAPQDNWRLTGETRTYFLPGGSLLMEELVRAAAGGSVKGSRFAWPAALAPGSPPQASLTGDALLALAPRLTREEMVHSLLSLDLFPAEAGSRSRRIRVQHTHGFSGPKDHDPALPVLPPDASGGVADIVVLDDTGNEFRRSPDRWPVEIASAAARPWIVHKLHRPLPGDPGNALWDTLRQTHAERHIVIVSIDDLRAAGAPISRGLSWERTALELVWQLLNVETFAALRDCAHLIVRLELDGALCWTSSVDAQGERIYSASLIYDPSGIEGTGERLFEGRMVGYGTAFVAGVAKSLANATSSTPEGLQQALAAGAATGLRAARRLLALAFGAAGRDAVPRYPGAELFDETPPATFARQPVPIIRSATEPDRGYWRLLDSVFAKNTASLHRAVALKATGAAPGAGDKKAQELLAEVPVATFAKALSAYDRHEIESYRALYSLMYDYVHEPGAARPLSVAVFGPPGAGKSFGVKMVARELERPGRPMETLTFNLSQCQTPDELAAAFHLVRDSALRGKVPLVFFDEFDTTLNGVRLGWLRYFLAPMQDGEFLDRGAPHPIGQAIFVFAGGTCGSYTEFARPFGRKNQPSGPAAEDELSFSEFKAAKGPDFLSRLRATLDIPGLDLSPEFDAYGPVEAFPCEAAILLRRANILRFQLGEKAKDLRDATGALRVSEPVLRALLHVPQFTHGNRSFEALLDMSHLRGVQAFTPSALPAPGHTNLHANATHLSQLLAITYPFSEADRLRIAEAIHNDYLEQRRARNEFNPKKASHQPWDKLVGDSEKYRNSNVEQADDIPRKLRLMGRWLRKADGPVVAAPLTNDPDEVERYAMLEHDRWVANMRHNGYVWGPGPDENPVLRTHPSVIPWNDPRLTEQEKQKDRDAVEAIPRYLAAAGYEVIEVS